MKVKAQRDLKVGINTLLAKVQCDHKRKGQCKGQEKTEKI